MRISEFHWLHILQGALRGVPLPLTIASSFCLAMFRSALVGVFPCLEPFLVLSPATPPERGTERSWDGVALGFASTQV